MAIVFIKERVSFAHAKGKTQVKTRTLSFTEKVNSVGLAINGFRTSFGGDDHKFREQMIDISHPDISGKTVTFSVSLLLRDNSGDIDDLFEGFVDVLAIADIG